MNLHWLAIFAILLLTSCTVHKTIVIHEESGSGMYCSEVFFGMAIGDSVTITENEWVSFVDTVIAAEFPDGFTIADAEGYWKGLDSLLIHEPSKVLVIIHADTMVARVDTIRAKYKRYYWQEAVLRSTYPVSAEF